MWFLLCTRKCALRCSINPLETVCFLKSTLSLAFPSFRWHPSRIRQDNISLYRISLCFPKPFPSLWESATTKKNNSASARNLPDSERCPSEAVNCYCLLFWVKCKEGDKIGLRRNCPSNKNIVYIPFVFHFLLLLRYTLIIVQNF